MSRSWLILSLSILVAHANVAQAEEPPRAGERGVDGVGFALTPNYKNITEGGHTEHTGGIEFGPCYARHGHKAAGKVCLEFGIDTRLNLGGAITADIVGVVQGHWGFGAGGALFTENSLGNGRKWSIGVEVGPVFERSFHQGPFWSIALQPTAVLQWLIPGQGEEAGEAAAGWHLNPGFMFRVELTWALRRYIHG